MADLILKSQGISKRFGGVQALDKIDFELRQGEVHALVGENGAGKSTYIKILAGVYQKDEGESVYDGRKINFRSNLEARQQGIGMVPQLIDLAPKLTVAENIYMGVYPRTRMGFIDWKKLYAQAENIAKTFGMEGMVRTPVERLGTGHRQLIEVLKALIYDTKIIAFDEPTAALSDEETRWLFDLIRTLRGKGISVIYVSHRLDELFQIADRVSVLKDGQYVGTREIAEINKDEIISMMVGRELNLFGTDTRKKQKDKEVLLEVKDLRSKNNINGVSFKVYKGEILGCFGMVGSGRTETAMAVFGADEKDEGVITLKGETVHIGTPTQAVRLGVGLVPENRITQGVILKAAIRNNITLPFVNRLAKKRAGFIDMREEKVISANYMAQLKVKAPHDLAKVVTLSGGNQQKVSIAKWLATRSDVIIFDEPTHGIDVGAKADIYRLLRGLSEEGKGVVMISSELPEVLNVCDRILVFRDGKIVHEFTENKGLTEEEVVAYAIG
ncbi:MAG: sugar ABC transporter ATP-binding protein [Spirochaetales bacterium]|nr:MAG: sugar ABC transporter ATP-binding protein [Spirochaetales bacterium]